MADEKMSRVLLVLLALALMLVPIKFYFDLDRLYVQAANAGMLLDPWEFRIFIYIEITSAGCFLAVIFSSRKMYWAALVFLLCQIGILLFWYTRLLSWRLEFQSIPGNPWLIPLQENPENIVQMGIALLLLLLIGRQLIVKHLTTG